MVCGKQRRRCCAFSALSAIKGFIVSVTSQKKLNTDGVESPCERLPGVGSFLANPGLSKEQLVPSCMGRTFILRNSFIKIMAQYRRHCVVTTFIMVDVSIEILVHFGVYLFACCHQLYYKMHISTP